MSFSVAEPGIAQQEKSNDDQSCVPRRSDPRLRNTIEMLAQGFRRISKSVFLCDLPDFVYNAVVTPLVSQINPYRGLLHSLLLLGPLG